MLTKPNKKSILKYIKLYEHFEIKIPESLKVVFSQIREIIGEQKTSFKKSINLGELGFCNIIINIDVKFDKLTESGEYDKHNIIYYSNINIHELVSPDVKEIDIPIYIKDVFIIPDKLISIISHEVRHIYDVYNTNNVDYETDMISFIKTLYYNILKNNEENKEFKHFLYLVYLTLEHELIARNTMIWEMFMNSHCSKDKLYELYKESSIYESFNILYNFNYNDILKVNNLIEKVNTFIGYFGGEKCVNSNDVILFFKKWDEFFKNKSYQFKREGYLVLDDLYELIKENYKFDNTKKKNVKDILLDIHKNFIFNEKE